MWGFFSGKMSGTMRVKSLNFNYFYSRMRWGGGGGSSWQWNLASIVFQFVHTLGAFFASNVPNWTDCQWRQRTNLLPEKLICVCELRKREYVFQFSVSWFPFGYFWHVRSTFFWFFCFVYAFFLFLVRISFFFTNFPRFLPLPLGARCHQRQHWWCVCLIRLSTDIGITLKQMTNL